MSTQAAIDTAVNEIVNNPSYVGQKISYYGTYHGECSVPVAYFVERLTGMSRVPSMYGARADGWGVSFPAQFAPYFRHEAFQPGKAYPRGTILMWPSPHIALVLSHDGSNNAVVFEQNADPDGSVCGTKTRELNNKYRKCTYALVPIIDPAIVPPAYTSEPYHRQLIVIGEQPYKYDCNIRDFTERHNNPIEGIQKGAIFQCEAVYTTADGSRYYVEDTQNSGGYFVPDCDAYVEPPKPYVPPAGAATVPRASKYTLVADIPTYQKAIDALNKNNKVGKLASGEYYVRHKDNEMLNLSTDNMHDGLWINPKENVLPPPPPPSVIEAIEVKVQKPLPELLKPSQVLVGDSSDERWKIMTPFHADRSPEVYQMLMNYTAIDYSGLRKTPQKLLEGQKYNVVGTFVKNGVKFYRLRDYHNDVHFMWYYGVPVFNDDDNPMMKKIMPELPASWADLWHNFRDEARQLLGPHKVWDIILKTKYKEIKK